MEYKNIDSQHILVRLDPNDEIVTSLMQVAKEEKIELAMVQGIAEADLVLYASDAHANRRLMDNNPIDMSVEDVHAIYRAAF